MGPCWRAVFSHISFDASFGGYSALIPSSMSSSMTLPMRDGFELPCSHTRSMCRPAFALRVEDAGIFRATGQWLSSAQGSIGVTVGAPLAYSAG